MKTQNLKMTVKCPDGQMSDGQMSDGQMSDGQMSRRSNVRRSNVPTVKCPDGQLSRRSNVRRSNVRVPIYLTCKLEIMANLCDDFRKVVITGCSIEDVVGSVFGKPEFEPYSVYKIVICYVMYLNHKYKRTQTYVSHSDGQFCIENVIGKLRNTPHIS